TLLQESDHGQSRDKKIAGDAAVERLEAEIGGKTLHETQLHGAIDGAEFGVLTGILAEGNFDGTVDRVCGPGAGNVVHFDVAIDVAAKKGPVDIAHADATFVDVPHFDID